MVWTNALARVVAALRGKTPRPVTRPAGGKTRPGVEHLEERLVLSSDTLTVNTGTILNSIAYPFVGVNQSNYWDSLPVSGRSQQALKNAGVQVIRFEGGEGANYTNGVTLNAGERITQQQAVSYANGVGADVLLQTNPTTGGNNDPSGAHWASVLTSDLKLGAKIPWVEIGNENDGAGGGGQWAVGGSTAAPDYSKYQNYITAFNQQAAALHAADPGVKVVGNNGTNEYQWWGLGSLNYFLRQTGNKTGSGQDDAVSVHEYPLYQQYPGWANVESLGEGWQNRWAVIRRDIAANDTRNLPVFITETNAADGSTAGSIVKTNASALANLDWLEAIRNSGAQQVDFFGSVHDVGNGWGLLYGANDWGPADTASPKYYVLPFLTHQGNQVLGVGGLTDPSNTLSAYASQSPNGNVQVVVINKTGQARDVNLSFTGFDPTGRHVNVYQLVGASGGVWDSDVIYNGVKNPDVTSANGLPAPLGDTATGSTFDRSVPAYSMTMYEFSVNNAHSAPVARISSPADTGVFAGGSVLTLSADAFATQGNLSRVEFYANGVLVGTATGGAQGAAGNPASWATAWANVQPGTYSITAKAYDDGGGVTTSAPVSITVNGTISLPAAPTGLKAVGGDQTVALTWTPSAGATSYVILRGTAATGESATPVATVTAASYTDTGLTNGTTYYYKVEAVNAAGTSGASTEASATPQVAAPAAPTNVLAVAGDAQVTLSWTGPANATSYQIFRGTSPGGEGTAPYKTGVTGTGFTDTGLTDGVAYYYQVVAVDAGGTSSRSAEVKAVPAGQPAVITPATASQPVVTGTTVGLSVVGAEGGSDAGLTYTWASTGPAAVTYSANGTTAAKQVTATFTAAGAYTFTVTIKDAAGQAVTSAVSVIVAQVVKSVAVTPGAVRLLDGGTQPFAVSEKDQFGNSVTNPLAPAWSLTSGSVGTIDPKTGLYAAPKSGPGVAGVVASVVSNGVAVAGQASVTVVGLSVGTGTGLLGQFFAGTNFSTLVATRVDPTVNFAWARDTAPLPGMPADNWSVRWTGKVQALTTEAYQFVTTADDGVRLYVNGQLVINDWTTHAARTDVSSPMNLQAGQTYTIEMDYFEAYGLTAATLSWQSAAVSREVIPATQLYAQGPAVAAAAAAAAPTVTGKSVNLSVLGTEAGTESGLTYSWKVTGPAAVAFSANGTNAAKQTTATFSAAGTYAFTATVTDPVGRSVTSTVSVTVGQTLTGLAVTPGFVSLADSAAQRFTAAATDQFGTALTAAPAVSWSLAANSLGSIDPVSGVYTAPAAGTGTAGVTATAGVNGAQVVAHASVQVVGQGPSVAKPATATYQPGTTYLSLSVLGADPAGEGSLGYSWTSSGPAAVSVYPNGSNSAKTAYAFLTQAGTYTFTVTVKDAQGRTVTSTTQPVAVPSVLRTLVATPGAVMLKNAAAQQFSVTGQDQFGKPAGLPALVWTVAGSGTVTRTGLYTAPATGSGVDTVTVTAGPVAAVIRVSFGLVPPAAVQASTGDSWVVLTWASVSSATSYNVYRSTTPGGEGAKPYAAGITKSSYTDFQVTPGTKYYYKVTAVGAGGESTASAEAAGSPGPALNGSNVLLVYNLDEAKDEDHNGVQDSYQIAQYYAGVRGVPADHVLGLHFGANDYILEENAAAWAGVIQPLQQKLQSLPGVALIQFSYDTPEYIHDANGGHTSWQANALFSLQNALQDPWVFTAANTAAGTALANTDSNVAYQEPVTPDGSTSLGHFRPGGVRSADGHTLYLASAIDGPDLNVAYREIDGARYAEDYMRSRPGTPGTYSGTLYVDANGPYSYYNAPIDSSATFLARETDYTVRNDTSGKVIGAPGATFTDGTSATNPTNVAGYAGWYYSTQYANNYSFLPGASFVDLESGSANDIRDSSAGTNYHNGGRSLYYGATATVGNVNEPYLNWAVQPQQFAYAFYVEGLSLAEASLASQPLVGGWMGSSFGDGLFRLNPQGSGKTDTAPPALDPAVPLTVVKGSNGTAAVRLVVDQSKGPKVVQFGVEFGTTTAYGTQATMSDVGYLSRDTATFTGLKAGVTYHYRVTMADAVGHVVVGPDQTFVA